MVSLNVEIDGTCGKWENTCRSRRCGDKDILAFCAEISVKVKAAVVKLKAIIGAGVGITEVQIDIIVKILVEILVRINLCLNILLKLCGYRNLILSYYQNVEQMLTLKNSPNSLHHCRP